MEAAAKRGNTKAVAALAELNRPSRPPELEYLWRWWIQLNAGRAVGMGGPSPITYQDIEAWARLTGEEPDALEVEGLMLLDVVMRTEPEK